MTATATVADRRTAPPHVDRHIGIVVVAAVIVPVVAAVVRNLFSGWLPIGDNAYFTVRSRDVLTDDHPLLGAWSSGSLSVDTFVNNLGPLQLDLLAPFTKIGPAAGTIIGVGLVNIAAIAGIAYVARRLAGPLGLAVTMAGTATLTWSMGSQMLIEPRQHPAMLLPFLCFLVAVWPAVAGRAWSLWIAVLAGSLVIQTHLSYAILVPAMAVPAIAGLALAGQRAQAGDDDTWWPWRQETLRHVGIGAAVAALCWAQPLWDQFFGNHNMTEVLQAGGESEAPGVSTGVRVVAGVVALPPWWGRDSFSLYDPNIRLPGTAEAWIATPIVAAIIVGAGFVAWRARQRIGVAGAMTAAVALLAGIASAAQLPTGFFGLPIGNYRWLWPLGAFCLVAVVVAVAGGTNLSRPGRQRVKLAATGVALVVGLLNLPYSYQSRTWENGTVRIEVTDKLTGQLADADLEGPVLVDRSNGFFGEPYTFATLVELQSLGIEFRFDVEGEIYRWGDGRRADGEERTLLTFAYGDDARGDTPAGATRVAYADGLGDGDQDELLGLTPVVLGHLRDGRIRVDLDDAKAQAEREYPATAAVVDGGPPPRAPFLSNELRDLQGRGFLDGAGDALDDLARWRSLVSATSDAVAIYATPINR